MISRNVRKVREGASKSACARPRKPPEAEHENACFTGCTKRVNSSAFPNSPFRVARRAGDFAWPEGAFRVRRCGKARQGQGRCGAHGEAKPHAVRRCAFLAVATRRPAARRLSWSRASAPPHSPTTHPGVAGLAARGGRSSGQGWQVWRGTLAACAPLPPSAPKKISPPSPQSHRASARTP